MCCGGCAGGPAELPVKDVMKLGYLRAEWVAGDFGERDGGVCWTFRAALRFLGPVEGFVAADHGAAR